MCKTVMTEQSEIEKTVLDSLLCDDLLEKAPHIASEIIEKNGSKIPDFNETNDLSCIVEAENDDFEMSVMQNHQNQLEEHAVKTMRDRWTRLLILRFTLSTFILFSKL